MRTGTTLGISSIIRIGTTLGISSIMRTGTTLGISSIIRIGTAWNMNLEDATFIPTKDKIVNSYNMMISRCN